ncbi:hypothetical protein AB1K18_04620 [Peribacillus simplex]|uniref:hypothetical protein n=1 Tax=Peribacillus simplex TaxID=1478 RepID=UPI003B8B352E
MYLVSLLVILIYKVRKLVYQWNVSWLSECPRVSGNQLLQEGLVGWGDMLKKGQLQQGMKTLQSEIEFIYILFGAASSFINEKDIEVLCF